MSIRDGEGFSKISGTVTNVSSSPGASNPFATNEKWVRLTNDGATVSVKLIVSGSEPTEGDWSSASAVLSTTALDADKGGLLGFAARDGGTIKFDDLTVKTDRDANGSYETTEYEGDFTLDADGYEEQDLEHDAAGNVTYDGRYAYAYDAFNRLVEVQIAYYAPGDTTLSYGSVITENHYDALGRRTIKYVKNSADRNCTYHYYYDAQSIIEERDGSDNVLRQNVWGLQYIDELLKTSLNDDPDDSGEQNVEQHYYVLHDTQYNILAITDPNGRVEERYEYTPFGEQICFRSLSANNDLLAMSAFSHVERKWVGGTIQPYGRNPFGFQGLHHDEESDLIYNRARMLNPRLKRFNQRDPLGYPDGLNTYAAYHVMYGGVDPSGMIWNGRDLWYDKPEDVWIIQTLLNNNAVRLDYEINLGNSGPGKNGIDGKYGSKFSRGGKGSLTWNSVCAMQRYLKRHGYDPGKIDGYWGKDTTKAYKLAETAGTVNYRYAHLRLGIVAGISGALSGVLPDEEEFGEFAGVGWVPGGGASFSFGLHFSMEKANEMHKAFGGTTSFSSIDGVAVNLELNATVIIAWNIFRAEDWTGMSGNVQEGWNAGLGPFQKKIADKLKGNKAKVGFDIATGLWANKDNIKSSIDSLAAHIGGDIWKGKADNATFSYPIGVGAGAWTEVKGTNFWTSQFGIGR